MFPSHNAALAATRPSLPGRVLAGVTNYWVALYWILLCLAIGWLYWPALCGEVPAFRDAFHFYYPLEYWLASQSEAGRYAPHYNPWDGVGVNLIGETSSGLCYPGRVLWQLPGLAVEQRFGVVLAVHTLLAAIGAAYAARRMSLSPMAQCLAATAYALGGAVLFQHTNPVYLIGAAWTPWALAESWVLAHQPRGDAQRLHGAAQPRMAVWVSATALMLLGGDPQATANAGIIAGLALVTRLAVTRSWRVFGWQVIWLAGAVLIVTGLTAAQWMPARHWLQHSQRATAPIVRDEAVEPIAELPKLLRPLAQSLQQDTEQDTAKNNFRGSGRGSTYAYSVAPWHLVTLFWGTAGGHFLPDHTRWPQALPGEPRMWTASLSIGLLPMLFILAGWSRRSTRHAQRFLLVVAVVSAAAMFGNFAPVWLLRQAFHACGADRWAQLLPGDEVGGMYWCFAKFVPGYSAFRYPAKWSVWFACALALCAAGAYDRHRITSPAFVRLCLIAAALSLTGAAVVAWLQWMPAGRWAYAAFANGLAAAGSDPWLGRPDAQAVLQLWLQAALVAAAMSSVCVLFVRLGGHRSRLRALVLVLSLAEMVWAGNKWLVTVDASRLDTASIATLAATAKIEQPLVGRVWASAGRAHWESWSAAIDDPAQASGTRVDKICGYQMLYRLGKLHLLRPSQANVAALMSLTPRSLSAVRSALAQADDLRPDNPVLDEALAWLGVSQRLVAGDRLRWQSITAARPLVELLGSHDVSAGAHRPEHSWHVEHFGPDRLRLRVSSLQESRLLVRLLQDGGWSAKLIPLEPRPGEDTLIRRKPTSTHLGLFQTLNVPPGNWSIELSYRAPGCRLGLGITLATLVLVLSAQARRYSQIARRRAPL